VAAGFQPVVPKVAADSKWPQVFNLRCPKWPQVQGGRRFSTCGAESGRRFKVAAGFQPAVPQVAAGFQPAESRLVCRAARGCPCPVAGRSRMPSWHPLTRMPPALRHPGCAWRHTPAPGARAAPCCSSSGPRSKVAAGFQPAESRLVCHAARARAGRAVRAAVAMNRVARIMGLCSKSLIDEVLADRDD
jgi:hypothetical protein